VEALADPELPTLRALAESGAVGLVAVPVRASRDEESVALSLSCGQPVRAGALDRLVRLGNEQVEGTAAIDVLRRRTGCAVSATNDVAVHLGIAVLCRRTLCDKLLASRFSERNVSRVIGTARVTNDEKGYRIAALFASDSDGIAQLTPPWKMPIVVVHAGYGAHQVEQALRWVLAEAQGSIWVIGMPRYEQGNGYAVPPALTVLSGPGTLRGVLYSATTRTTGLISFSDVSASLLKRVAGGHSTTGHAVSIVTSSEPIPQVRALHRVAVTNICGMVPVLLACGVAVVVAVILALAALAGAQHCAGPALGLLRAAMAIPLAFLMAGQCVERLPRPLAWWEYIALVAAVAALLAAVIPLCARFLPARASAERKATAFLVVTAVVIIGDGLLGQPLMRASLLAACGMSGIRFYGVGNEYMAILVGCLLGILFLLRLRAAHALAFGVFAMLFFGLGTVGANGGGVVTACAGFGFAAIILKGRPVARMRYVLLLPILGIALAFLFAGADAQLFGQGSSHLGGALQAAKTIGLAELRDIAVRKFLMNIGILTSRPMLFALAVLAFLVSVGSKRVREEVDRLSGLYQGWVQWLPAAVYTAAVAFLFNDTGVVAALFIVGVWAIVGLFVILGTHFGRSARARLVE